MRRGCGRISAKSGKASWLCCKDYIEKEKAR